MQGGRQRKKMKKRKICVIRKPKTNPTLVLSKPKRTLKVRITQRPRDRRRCCGSNVPRGIRKAKK